MRTAACGGVVLGAALLAAAACGAGDASPTAASQSVGRRTPVQFSVMTFNIQHGIDGTGRYDLQRAIDVIARMHPDVAGLQEVTRNHPSYSCDDQPARLAAGLRAATGEAWDATYQQEWFTPDTSCQASGRGSGPETEGLVLLSRHGLSAASTVALPDSRIGLEAGLGSAYGLPVVVTHLTSGSSAGGTRQRQIERLVSWAGGFGEPRILMGDFNAAPTGGELAGVLGSYRDAWTDAAAMGRASGTGITHGRSRIDYVFFVPGGALTLDSAEVVDTTALVGVAASDHSPLLVRFTVR